MKAVKRGSFRKKRTPEQQQARDAKVKKQLEDSQKPQGYLVDLYQRFKLRQQPAAPATTTRRRLDSTPVMDWWYDAADAALEVADDTAEVANMLGLPTLPFEVGAESTVRKYVDDDRCLVANFLLYPQSQFTLFTIKKVLMVGPIPITLSLTVNLNYQAVLNTLVCIADRAFVVNIEPTAGPELVLFGGIELPFFSIGIQAVVWIFRATVSLELSFMNKRQLHGGIQACRAVDVSVLPFQLKIELLLNFPICIKFDTVRMRGKGGGP